MLGLGLRITPGRSGGVLGIVRATIAGLTANPEFGPTAQHGVALTASYAGASSWQWQERDNPSDATPSDISGATSDGFTPNIGTNITDGYQIRAVPDANTDLASAWYTVRYAGPAVDTAAEVAGDPVIGESLTGTEGTFTGSGLGSVASKWQHSTNDATWVDSGDTDTTGPAMVSGRYYRFVSEVTNSGGTATTASSSIGPAVAPVITMGGLTGGEAALGDYASITLSADQGTITARKWGSTSGGSEFGTGTNPTDYDASEGATLYGTATVGGVDYTVSAPIEAAEVVDPPSLTGSVASKSWERGVAITTVDLSTEFSGTVTAYALTVNSDPLPDGVTLDSETGEITGTPFEISQPTEPFAIEVEASNAGGSADPLTFTITVDQIEISEVSADANSIDFTTDDDAAATVYWTAGDGVPDEADVLVGAGTGIDESGSFAIAGTGTSGEVDLSDYVTQEKTIAFVQLRDSDGKRSALITVTETIAASEPARMLAPSVYPTGGTTIEVDRAAAPGDGGGTISQYDLRHSTDESSWTTVTDIASADEEIGSLANDTLYYVQTRAVNENGAGAWSPSGSATTNAAVTYTLQNYAEDYDAGTGYIEVTYEVPQSAIDASEHLFLELHDSVTPPSRNAGTFDSVDLGEAEDNLTNTGIDVRPYYGQQVAVHITVGDEGASNTLSGALIEIPESAPRDALDTDFDVATGTAGNQSIVITINTVPTVHSDGTQYPEYRVDGGSWTELTGYSGADDYEETMAAAETEYDIEIRWTNEIGSGAENPTPDPATSSTGAGIVPFSDDFNGSINGGWTFSPNTADGKTAPSIANGNDGSDYWAAITIADDGGAAGAYDYEPGGLGELPTLLQPCNDEAQDLRLGLVDFPFDDTTDWHGVGLVISNSDDSEFVVVYKGSNDGTSFRVTNCQSTTDSGANMTSRASSTSNSNEHVRLTFDGVDAWQVYDSANGSTWTSRGTWTQSFTPAKFGAFILNASTNGFEARIDYVIDALNDSISDPEGGEP